MSELAYKRTNVYEKADAETMQAILSMRKGTGNSSMAARRSAKRALSWRKRRRNRDINPFRLTGS